METTALKVNWDEDFSKEENGGGDDNKKIPYMSFPNKAKYTIRLVGSHVKFLRHWKPFKSSDRVITHPSYKNEDPAWQNKFYPRTTFAIHIIDRADGKLKILEKGSSLFKQFAEYKTVNDIDPSKNDGPDWVIDVDWPGKNKLQTKYSATAKAKAAPFTKEEIAMIKENQVKLSEMYKATSLDKIKELWENVPEEDRIPPEKETEKTEETKQVDTNTASEDTVSEDAVSEDAVSETINESDDNLFGDDETDF